MLNPIQANNLDLPDIRHGFFTREGGVSTGLYASLNCGPGSRDDPAAVAENRARMAAHLGAGHDVSTPYQVHGATALVIDKPVSAEDRPKADALVTRTPGLAVGVLTADCAPVLFAAPASGVVAVAHAGWRGAVAGVLEATVAAMTAASARRDDIRAAVGPCIRQESYEVGLDFEAELLALDAANARFFARPSNGPKPFFDLLNYVVSRLHDCGVRNVETSNASTYDDDSRFFSFRRTTHRSEPDYGRQISAIVVV